MLTNEISVIPISSSLLCVELRIVNLHKVVILSNLTFLGKLNSLNQLHY
jgi:hypothetical protein